MKWEYKTVMIKCTFSTLGKVQRDIQDKANELGEEGWELVNGQCFDLATKFVLIFKREKK